MEHNSDITGEFQAKTVQTLSGDDSQSDLVQPQIKYAGFWVRFIAIFVDNIIIAVFCPLLSFFFFFININVIILFNPFVWFFLYCLYSIFMTYKYKATFGKMIVGIRVVSNGQFDLTFGQIILRETIGKLFSAIILYIGYIMAGFTEKKQALHDKIANTVVEYTGEPASKKAYLLIVSIILMTFSLFVYVALRFSANVIGSDSF
jgi:uncharacterized RDD family membrane protein YckC